MTIQHRDVIDAQRHEPKGASTALAGQVARANGSGTTAFVNPNTLVNITTTTVVNQGSVAAQTPSALGTPIQVEFGSATSTTDINLASNGTITINTSGYYKFSFSLNVTRTAGAGDAYLLARVLLNGVQNGSSRGVKMNDGSNNLPLHESFEGNYSAGNTIQIQFLRDSLGINNGSLSSIVPVTAGWASVPSAWLRVSKVQGAS